MTATAVTLSPF